MDNTLNGYLAFFNGKQKEIYASTSFEAYTKACEFFKPAKSKKHLVHVHLCEKAGQQVVHTATF